VISCCQGSIHPVAARGGKEKIGLTIS
jgi:hypothetical protein